jgi:hypothetical protein
MKVFLQHIRNRMAHSRLCREIQPLLSTDPQKGSALIMSIVVMAMVAIRGVVGANTSLSDSRNSSVFRQGSTGFYAGEAGLQLGSKLAKGKSYTALMSSSDILTDPDSFTWPTSHGDTSSSWKCLDQTGKPKAMYQPFVPSTITAGRARCPLPGEDNASPSVRSGSALGGIANSIMEVSRVCVRSQGFSPNEKGQIESRIEEQMISYASVAP